MNLLKAEECELSLDEKVNMIKLEKLEFMANETVIYLTGYSRKLLSEFLLNSLCYESEINSIFSQLFFEPSEFTLKKTKINIKPRLVRCIYCDSMFKSWGKKRCRYCNELIEVKNCEGDNANL